MPKDDAAVAPGVGLARRAEDDLALATAPRAVPKGAINAVLARGRDRAHAGVMATENAATASAANAGSKRAASAAARVLVSDLALALASGPGEESRAVAPAIETDSAVRVLEVPSAARVALATGMAPRPTSRGTPRATACSTNWTATAIARSAGRSSTAACCG